MKKAIVLTLSVILAAGAAFAQAQNEIIPANKARAIFGNTIRLSAGGYVTENMNGGSFISQVGIHYERKVSGNWFVGIGYAQWEEIDPMMLSSARAALKNVQERIYYPGYAKVGDLLGRANYRMVDLYSTYRLTDMRSRRHAINIGAGISYTWGKDSYLTYSDRHLQYHFVREEGMEKNAGYLGMIPSLSYDFGMFNNRIIVGFNFRARYYFGMDMQYDHGIHIGVNF